MQNYFFHFLTFFTTGLAVKPNTLRLSDVDGDRIAF